MCTRNVGQSHHCSATAINSINWYVIKILCNCWFVSFFLFTKYVDESEMCVQSIFIIAVAFISGYSTHGYQWYHCWKLFWPQPYYTHMLMIYACGGYQTGGLTIFTIFFFIPSLFLSFVWGFSTFYFSWQGHSKLMTLQNKNHQWCSIETGKPVNQHNVDWTVIQCEFHGISSE